MLLYFIAIGGSAMHNLAIALAGKGNQISGSDDEIFEPSKSRLARYGLLPEKTGWDASRITSDLDAVILGMHAKRDNPELLKAKELGLKIYSYPEFLYEQTKDKQRIVIGGSHGKTTITAMILHALRCSELDCDYLVGAQLEGFEVMVKLTAAAPIMIFEGDEYLTSPIDLRPKFHLYKPDIALLSGIAWDHINVFPTYDNYVDQFRIFIRQITPGGSLIWCSGDTELQRICPGSRNDITFLPYALPTYEIHGRQTSIRFNEKKFPLQVFGTHNLLNMEGARLVCNQLGVGDDDFYTAMQTFKGASKRLEIVYENDTTVIFKDFAHAPSKVGATLSAVKEQFPGRKVVACLELHTFSSLNREFLGHYKGTMDSADVAIVYFSPHALALKRLPALTHDQVKEGFFRKNLEVFDNVQSLLTRLSEEDWSNSVLLMMSSGNFDGLNLKGIGEKR